MSITADKAKERKSKILRVPKRKPLRPTTSKVRESIFNIIGDNISGTKFLDLYAGTGAIGLEAMKRGAELVVFVEKSIIGCKQIKKTALELGFDKGFEIWRMNVMDYLKNALKKDETFDTIFIDPPYQSEEINPLLPFIAGGELLKNKGMIIIEHSSKRGFSECIGELKQKKRYIYGDTTLTTYHRRKYR